MGNKIILIIFFFAVMTGMFILNLIATFGYRFLYNRKLCRRCIGLEIWDGKREYRLNGGIIDPKLLDEDGTYKIEVCRRRKRDMRRFNIVFLTLSIVIQVPILMNILY